MTDNKTKPWRGFRSTITPTPHLMLRWQEEARDEVRDVANHFDMQSIQMIKAANWGWHQRDASVANELQEARDEELEECRKAIADQIITVDNIGLSGPAGVLHTKAFSSWPAFAQMVSRQLRDARRPQPLSLKELNLKHLEVMERDGHYLPEIIADLRRAIESLPS